MVFPAPDWSAKSTIDLKVGGKYTLEMFPGEGVAGCGGEAVDKGKSYPHSGEYLEIKPYDKLVFTWNSSDVQNTRVTIDLKDLEGSTEIVLTHALLPSEESCQRHTQGWTGCPANLQKRF